MNPLAVLLPALYAKLNTPALAVDGVAVPAEQHLAGNTKGHYVFITQPTDTDAGGSTGCEHFSCTVLLDVVTQFHQDYVTSLPAEQLVSQINARLRRQRLVLPTGWDCQPGVLEPGTQLEDDAEGFVRVRRLLRYRWEVYYHGVPAPPVFVARALWAGGLRDVHGGATRLASI